MSEKITFADRRRNWARMLFGIPEAPARPGDVAASNYMDATDRRAGVTIAGAVYKTATRVGRRRWNLGTKEFDE